jgi:hypothetical protein
MRERRDFGEPKRYTFGSFEGLDIAAGEYRDRVSEHEVLDDVSKIESQDLRPTARAELPTRADADYRQPTS